MGIIRRYPYTDYYEANLDWILHQICKIDKRVEDWINYTEIKYADPIEWDILHTYDANTIVIHENDSYLSKKPVTAGVDITNGDYWLKIGNFSGSIHEITEEVNRLKAPTYHGKKIVAYGDSTGTSATNFFHQLTEEYKLDIDNRCVGGTALTLPDTTAGVAGITRILAADDLDNFDYLFILFGINDWQLSRTVADYADCVRQICEKMVSCQQCMPLFIFPWYCYRTFTVDGNGSFANKEGCDLSAYIDAAITVCETYHVKYLNFYNIAGVNHSNYVQWLNNDGGIYVHCLRRLGWKVAHILMSGVVNNGRCFTDTGDNVAEKIFTSADDGINPTNEPIALSLVGTFIAGSSNANISATTLLPQVNKVTRIHVKGTAVTDGDSIRITPYVTGSTLDGDNWHKKIITVPNGACFDYTFEIDFDEFSIIAYGNHGTYCIIKDLEIYADQPLTSKSYMWGSVKGAFKTRPYAHIEHNEFISEYIDMTMNTAISAGDVIAECNVSTRGRSYVVGTLIETGQPHKFVSFIYLRNKLYATEHINSGARVVVPIPNQKRRACSLPGS